MKTFWNKLKAFFRILRNLSDEKYSLARKITSFSFSLLSALAVFLLLFAPFCMIRINGNDFTPINAVGGFKSLSLADELAFLQLGVFAALALCLLLNVFWTLTSLLSLGNEKKIAKATRRTLLFDTAVVLVFSLFVFLFSPINILLGGYSVNTFRVGYIIYMGAVAILYALFVGITGSSRERREDESILKKRALAQRKRIRKALLLQRVELLVYTILNVVLALLALLTNIIRVDFKSTYFAIDSISLNGWNLIGGSSATLEEGQQILAYVIFALFVVLCSATFLSLISFLSSSELFSKIAMSTVFTASTAALVVGLFGKYYEIVQSMNEEMIEGLLKNLVSSDSLYTYVVSSSSLYFFIGSLLVVAVIFLRKPYSRILAMEKQIAAEDAAKLPQVIELSASEGKNPLPGGVATEGAAPADINQPNSFDPCPAFSVLDAKKEEYSAALLQKKSSLFDSPTLPRLIDFIVQYARDSRLHLFYTPESIATFLAGLGTTRLTILQGMSGTGKTSLPKIVAEALMSVCDIVEVESSWRDKNELLGYYNEFSKAYTPKKFTQALYRAKLNPEVITFIVLDEMNLSRIEYYFSDFLSLMENEPDKRELKLLGVPLVRTEHGQRYEYDGLTDGYTVKIPDNIWFIGTANRDESTYDISDKVYDRAHTMNFDKRAASVRYFNEPIPPKYLPVSTLTGLFEDAKARIEFRIEDNPLIAAVEKLLSPYNISFGNRIAMQIESFVKIYAACFTSNEVVLHDALETILLSKVVRKLELKSIDDKEGLAAEFAKLRLLKCSEFILSLKEE